jgi:hypothetical protein
MVANALLKTVQRRHLKACSEFDPRLVDRAGIETTFARGRSRFPFVGRERVSHIHPLLFSV